MLAERQQLYKTELIYLYPLRSSLKFSVPSFKFIAKISWKSIDFGRVSLDDYFRHSLKFSKLKKSYFIMIIFKK